MQTFSVFYSLSVAFSFVSIVYTGVQTPAAQPGLWSVRKD